MIEYITHHRYKKISMNGNKLNLPRGTKLEEDDNNILFTEDGKPVCFSTSENAKMHFAINNDGKGLERGRLTYAIAFADRFRQGKNGQKQRFTDAEIETLETGWSKWLRDDCEVVLFNDAFFAADPFDLRRLAKALNIKTK